MTRRPHALVAFLAVAVLLGGCTDNGPSVPSLTMPTAATHARFFPIAPGDVHGPPAGQTVVDCNGCHFDKVTGLPSAAFTTYTCTGCHVPAPTVMHDDLAALTAFHEASPAVAAITAKNGQPFSTHDAACRACHPQGIRDAVDHALHFPLPHRDAAGTTVARCQDCHVARTTGQYLVMGCAGCHPHDQAATVTGHAAVQGFVGVTSANTPAEVQAASALCIRCHGDGVVPVKVADHASVAHGFPIGTGSVHANAASSCLDCHGALRADPNKKLAADWEVTSCVACHAQVGAAKLWHDLRTDLEPFHLALMDNTVTPPVAIDKARRFTEVVDAAIVAAGGDAAKGLSAACVSCHPQGIGAHPYYLLPHQNAAKTVVAKCADCHVDTLDRTKLGCAACHAANSPIATRHALVPDVVPADTSVAASALCARCHEYDAIPTRVATTHTRFPIAPGSRHAGAIGGACLKCHPALKGQPTPWAADFKQTDCLGCHVPVAGGQAQHDDWAGLLPLHPGVVGFPATAPLPADFAAACVRCHPTGTVGPPADHGDYFNLAAGGKHVFPGPRITKCLDCHTSANRTTTTDFACATCHAADATPLATGHATVPDFAADPTNPVKCLACHANGVRPATSTGVAVTVAGHGVAAAGFTIGTGAHSGAAGGQCLVCHPANRAPSTTPPHWDYARDFKQTTCVGCHVSVKGGTAFHDDLTTLTAIHVNVTTFTSTVTAKGLSAACLYCHADGAGGAPPNHPLLFPITIGTKHAGIACAACHTNPANRKDLTAFACASCHAGPGFAKTLSAAHTVTGYTITSYQAATTAGGTRTTVQIDMTNSQTCLRCHAVSHVDRVASHTTAEEGFGKSDHKRAGCLTCHSRMRADQPWGALFTEAKGSAGPPPSGCYVCHASGSG